jgi:phospholipase/carboxylesterase
MEFQPFQYIYRSAGNPEAPTLLLLHGTGGDENDLLDLAARFGNNNNLLSLRGNVSEHGMPRFFKRLGMGVFDEEDLKFRTDELVDFVRKLAKAEGFNLHKLVALGYSNGANIAGSALFRNPDFLGGAILLRPMQPFKQLEAVAVKGIPVFATTGESDPTIRQADTVKYMDLLKESGYAVTHKELQAGHNLTQEDLSLSVSWFQSNFK